MTWHTLRSSDETANYPRAHGVVARPFANAARSPRQTCVQDIYVQPSPMPSSSLCKIRRYNRVRKRECWTAWLFKCVCKNTFSRPRFSTIFHRSSPHRKRTTILIELKINLRWSANSYSFLSHPRLLNKEITVVPIIEDRRNICARHFRQFSPSFPVVYRWRRH